MSRPVPSQHAAHDFVADILAIEKIEAVPTILEVVCRTTGMGFAAVARVTEDRWVACQVRDGIAFGLRPGGELDVMTTICREIRRDGAAVVIDNVAKDGAYCSHPTPALYGFQSYISVPIVLPTRTFWGTLCAIDPRPARLNTPEIVGTFKAFADLIAFHLDAQQRVSASTAERERLWQLSQDLLVIVTAEGTLQAVNAAWSRILGWEEHELVGRSLADFVDPDDVGELSAIRTSIVEQPLVRPRELRVRHKDGSFRWIAWTGAFEEGRIFANGRDITAHREQAHALSRTEEALRQSQKLEAIGQLTGGVAHDFNNLLTIIRSSVEFLQRPDLPEKRRQRYMDAVSDTVERASKLTRQLLAYARQQALNPEVFEVGTCLRAVGELLDPIMGARIRVSTEVPDSPCYVRADLSQFETALVNIAVNARDAMEGEGTLTLRLACIEGKPPIRQHAGSAGRFAAVSMTDTGSGIDPSLIASIFEPFFTTKEIGRGTGLGLSQVFGFAKQSGGDVDVVSVLGQGTTFTLYLPEVAGEIPQQTEDEPAVLVDGAGLRVLVVEDNLEVGRFATQILEDLGYATTWAHNAAEALTALSKDGTPFDAVFSDVVMPGMNGVELAREIRRRHPRLPIVLTSGYSSALAQDSSHGFELLQKPYSVEALSRILRQVIRKKKRRRTSVD
ncbi:response regulator [Methylobacterium isbiliense]|uniref:histidine kinase n=1 Tax=Methylobacterium isbiliense TaxID=315478 RepID=A0ABQ4SNI9_9HYPH|nr:response regulator [Methylobacterium isbiliense]MDN3627788.1 response regulator [Methylobacterium isbiliense]GJE03348.1 Sensor histidine kinase RcsC [Methylobacterium isbiliense]